MSDLQVQANGRLIAAPDAEPGDRQVVISLALTEKTSLVFTTTPNELIEHGDDVQRLFDESDSLVDEVLGELVKATQGGQS